MQPSAAHINADFAGRIVELDKIIGAAEQELGSAVAEGREKDVKHFEDFISSAHAERRRVQLGHEAEQRAKAERERQDAEAKHMADVDAARKDHADGLRLAQKADDALAALKTALDEMAAHGERMTRHDGIIDVGYWQ